MALGRLASLSGRWWRKAKWTPADTVSGPGVQLTAWNVARECLQHVITAVSHCESPTGAMLLSESAVLTSLAMKATFDGKTFLVILLHEFHVHVGAHSCCSSMHQGLLHMSHDAASSMLQTMLLLLSGPHCVNLS